MALHGTCSGKLDIKSPVDSFFKSFANDDRLLNQFNCFILEAEGEFDRSIDSEKRTVTIKMSGCQMSGCLILEKYNSVTATIIVTPKEDGDGGQVVWTVQFEKISLDIDDPQIIIDTIVNWLKDTDENPLL